METPTFTTEDRIEPEAVSFIDTGASNPFPLATAPAATPADPFAASVAAAAARQDAEALDQYRRLLARRAKLDERGVEAMATAMRALSITPGDVEHDVMALSMVEGAIAELQPADEVNALVSAWTKAKDDYDRVVVELVERERVALESLRAAASALGDARLKDRVLRETIGRNLAKASRVFDASTVPAAGPKIPPPPLPTPHGEEPLPRFSVMMNAAQAVRDALERDRLAPLVAEEKRLADAANTSLQALESERVQVQRKQMQLGVADTSHAATAKAFDALTERLRQLDLQSKAVVEKLKADVAKARKSYGV